MIKSSSVKIIFLLLHAVIIIPGIVCTLLGAPEVLHNQTINDITQSTDSADSPTNSHAQNAISAFRESIVIYDFRFRVIKVVFDETTIFNAVIHI